MKLRRCENCNSPVSKIKRGNKTFIECSYCGTPVDQGIEIEDFIPEYNGEDNDN